MNYYQFSAEDLAADDYFKEWVCSPTAETETFWQEFLRDYPERYYQVQEGRKLVAGLWVIQERPDLTDKVDLIWNRIEQTRKEIRPTQPVYWLTWAGTWKMAAAIVLLLGIGWVSWSQLKSNRLVVGASTPPADEWVETLNEASQVMEVQLADGSRVELQKGGHLRYRKELKGSQREVHLTGNAFFNVKKNPQRPFLVYANGLVTKVLGTSFFIKAPANATTVTVDVKSGRVSVYPNPSGRVRDPESRGMVLTPNQQVVFQREAITLNKTLVERPRLLISPKEAQQFVFEDASVTDVFKAIEQAYGVNVIFDEDVLRNCTLTMSLDDEDLFQKLTVICKLLQAEYKLIDAQIVIYSKSGCRGSEKPPSFPSKIQ